MKHLKLILKTLFSNNACVEAARTKELKYNIIAVIFAVLAVFLAVVPLNVNAFKKNGSDFISGTNVYNFDDGLQSFSEAMVDKGLQLVIEHDNETNVNKMTIKGDEAKKKEVFKIREEEDAVFDNEHENYYQVPYFVYKQKIDDYENYRSMEIYDFTEFDEIKFTTYCAAILNNLNPFINESQTISDTDQSRFLRYSVNPDGVTRTRLGRWTSCIFFGKYHVYAYMFRAGTTTVAGSVGGDYNSSATGVDLISQYYVKNDQIQTLKNWRPFFDQAYAQTRFNGAWRSTGIMVGVDVGILLFMGILVFILTRGKNNPFRIYSFWDCQKIAYFAALTPGILALLGFALQQFAMMMFILGVGVRVMWLNMRTLRYQAAK